MLVDCHAHAYPEEVAEKIIPRMFARYGIKPRHRATVPGLLDSMKASGVDKSLLLTIANKKEHVIPSNNWCIEVQDSHPDLLCFGSIHPDYEYLDEELERISDAGIVGIKLQPNAQCFYPDSERLFRVYEKLSDLGMALVFHAGDEVTPVEPLYAHPKNFVAVLDSFPDLTIVLAHLGGYKTYDSLHHVLGYRNVWYDTAFVPGNIPDDRFIEVVYEIGIDRVLFGTDFPWADPRESLEEIKRLFRDKSALILEKNPERFLSIICP